MNTPLEARLNELISAKSTAHDHHQFRMEPYKEITHADSFKAGCSMLMPLLLKAIEQRNHQLVLDLNRWQYMHTIEDDKKELRKSETIFELNKELLQLLENV